MRLPLTFRALLATIVPLTVAVIGPWLATGRVVPEVPSAWRLVFLLPMAAGAALLTWCIRLFARVGRGTLAPVDPPTIFVARGPYQFTRNPMYVSVSCWLLGLAALTNARALWWYALGAMLGFHAFVVLYEEPNLRRRFGASYAAYTHNVPRWLGRRRGTRVA